MATCQNKNTEQCCFYPQALVDMAPKYILEQFLESELLINITEHMVSCFYPQALVDMATI